MGKYTDQDERYFIFKENLLNIQDHNKAYENGSVTFSQKYNHFSHLTFEEFQDQFLTPLQKMETPRRAGSSFNKTKKEKSHLSFKPIRVNKHKEALAKKIASNSNSKFKRAINEETNEIYDDNHIDDYIQTIIENTNVESTKENKTFHHVNKFKQSRYARLALKMRKLVEKNNGGIFTLKAAKAAKITTTVVVDWTARGYVTPGILLI